MQHPFIPTSPLSGDPLLCQLSGGKTADGMGERELLSLGQPSLGQYPELMGLTLVVRDISTLLDAV